MQMIQFIMERRAKDSWKTTSANPTRKAGTLSPSQLEPFQTLLSGVVSTTGGCAPVSRVRVLRASRPGRDARDSRRTCRAKASSRVPTGAARLPSRSWRIRAPPDTFLCVFPISRVARRVAQELDIEDETREDVEVLAERDSRATKNDEEGVGRRPSTRESVLLLALRAPASCAAAMAWKAILGAGKRSSLRRP